MHTCEGPCGAKGGHDRATAIGRIYCSGTDVWVLGNVVRDRCALIGEGYEGGGAKLVVNI